MELSSAARKDPNFRFRGTLLLTQCLLGEVQVDRELAEYAVETLARVDTDEILHEPITWLMQSKYSDMVRDVVWRSLAEAADGWSALGKAWLAVGFSDNNWRLDADAEPHPSVIV